MTVASTTTAYDLSVDEVISDAFDLIGGEFNSASDLKKARRKLSMIFVQLMNRGIPLWKVSEVAVTTSASISSYSFDTDVVDVLDGIIQVSSSIDYEMQRISIFDYHDIPTKGTVGRPTQFSVERQRDNKVVRVWLTPDTTQYIMKFWVVKKIFDPGSYFNTLDIEFRYLPAIIEWLAYEMGKGRDGITEEKLNRLKADYQEKLMSAEESDREQGAFFVSPMINSPTRRF